MAAIVVLTGASPASAHALVESSDPAADALLGRAPATVAVTFTEPPDPELSQLDVLDSQGRSVTSGAGRPVPDTQRTLRVPLDASLPDGVYTVTWRTTSTTDGHTTGGSFAFGVGISPQGAVTPPEISVPEIPPPSPFAVAGRWLLYVGLAVSLATATMRFAVLGEPPIGARIVLPIAWAAAAIGLTAIAVGQADAAGVSVATLLDSATGGGLIRQAVAIAATGIAIAFAARSGSTPAIAAVGALAAIDLLFHALAGHAGASTSWRTFNVFVQWLHTIAVSIWIGGLVWLLVDLARWDDERATHIRRFSGLAGAMLAVVFVTGALRSVDLLGGWADLGRLLSTGWGDTLLVKLAIVAVLVGLAAWNRFVNLRRLDEGGGTSARRFVAGEVLLAAGVFGATAVLAGLPPAALQQPEGPGTPAGIVATGADFATTTRARLVLTPGVVGRNRFEASVTDFDTDRPVDAQRVALRFSLPDRPELGSPTLELHPSAGATWSATSSVLSIQGRWNAILVVQTATGSTEVPLTVTIGSPPAATTAPPPSGQRTIVSRAPGQPDLYTITLADGSSVQAYLDPASPGLAEVHFTAFDPNGNELPLASASATTTSPSGPEPVKLRRLTPGHFVGEVELTTGAWSFALDATAQTGGIISISFEQEVG